MKRLVVLAVLFVFLPSVRGFAQSSDTIVYAANRDRQIFRVNLTQGQMDLVGTLLVGSQAIEQDPETGYVYYFEYGLSADEFAYWDPATGANVRVRRYNPRPNFFAKRMAFGADGTLYVMDATDVLWTVDKHNGDLTKKGAVAGLVTGSRGGTGDIAFSPDGTLYLNTYRNIYTVDIPTLTATPLFVNLLASRQEGTGLAACDGALYATIADENIGAMRLSRIDLGDGTVTDLLQESTWALNDLTNCTVSTFTPPPAPAAPTGASAAATATGQVTLVWQDHADNESGFRIERATDSVPFSQVATVGANLTSYVDTGLAALTTYTYRVRAYNAGGNSEYSNTASATTPGNEAPAATIFQPVDGSVYAVGAPLTFSGDATDAEDGTLPDSAFTWEAAPVGGSFRLLAAGVRSGTRTLPAAGEFSIRLTVRDSGGLTDQKQVRVIVQ